MAESYLDNLIGTLHSDHILNARELVHFLGLSTYLRG